MHKKRRDPKKEVQKSNTLPDTLQERRKSNFPIIFFFACAGDIAMQGLEFLSSLPLILKLLDNLKDI